MDKSILYPYIVKAESFSKDKDWRDIIHSCACGKFPKGIRFDNVKNVLHVRYKGGNKICSEAVTLPTDPQKCYDTLMYIFKELLNLRTSKDVSESKQQLENVRLKNCVDLDCEWKKLPKSVKNYILVNFAITKIEKYGLEKENAKKLYKLIQLGFQFKQLTSDDVKYENGVISSISGLKYRRSTSQSGEDQYFPFYLVNEPGSITKTDKNAPKISNLDRTVGKWAKEHVIYGII